MISIFLFGCRNITINNTTENNESKISDISNESYIQEDELHSIQEDGLYSTTEEVANYINTYGRLPSNFITKKGASSLGWESNKGNLWEVTDKMSIGGDAFGNREKKLPSDSNRKWYECDVNYYGGFRGAERIVYSNDGLIYYTDDHYNTFTQLY
jgi:hypothetical protein